MNTILMLARASLWSRRGTILLTVLSVATSFALLIAVERLRNTTRSSFESTISGTDFLVGARGSEIQLLLYSVFRIGEPVQEVRWESYQRVASHPEVSWSVPLALGDSVKGFRVLGTTSEYFERYRYGVKQPLAFVSGHPFEDEHSAVVGNEVARRLGWSLAASFPLQHGVTEDAHAHENARFKVVGILAPTGTPVDRTVHIPLSGLALAHQEPDDEHHHGEEGHEEHEHPHGDEDEHHEEHEHEDPQGHEGHEAHEHHEEHEHEHHEEHEHDEAHAPGTNDDHRDPGASESRQADSALLAPRAEDPHLETISAAMIGLRSKMGLFRMRAWINDFADEPLMAVMPARAFQRLWSTVGVAEKALTIIGVMVSLAGVIALVATLLATVQARRREMALLRSVGASPSHIAVLIVGEALIVALTSAFTALLGVYVVGLFCQGLLARYGLRLSQLPITASELLWVGAFLATAILVSLIPALVTYRRSLADGLLVKI